MLGGLFPLSVCRLLSTSVVACLYLYRGANTSLEEEPLVIAHRIATTAWQFLVVASHTDAGFGISLTPALELHQAGSYPALSTTGGELEKEKAGGFTRSPDLWGAPPSSMGVRHFSALRRKPRNRRHVRQRTCARTPRRTKTLVRSACLKAFALPSCGSPTSRAFPEPR